MPAREHRPELRGAVRELLPQRSEEVVVAVPVPAAVQRHDQQVRGLEVSSIAPDPVVASVASHRGPTARPAPSSGSGTRAHAGRSQASSRAGSPRRRDRRRRTRPRCRDRRARGRAARYSATAHPSVRSVSGRRPRRPISPPPAARKEIGGVDGAEPQVVDPELEELPRSSNTCQREGRLGSGDEHDPGPRRDLPGEGANRAKQRRSASRWTSSTTRRTARRPRDRGGETGLTSASSDAGRRAPARGPRRSATSGRARGPGTRQVTGRCVIPTLSHADGRGSRSANWATGSTSRTSRGDHAHDRERRGDRSPTRSSRSTSDARGRVHRAWTGATPTAHASVGGHGGRERPA